MAQSATCEHECVTLVGLRWKLRPLHEDGHNQRPVIGVELCVGGGRDDLEPFSLDQAEQLALTILHHVEAARAARYPCPPLTKAGDGRDRPDLT